MNNYEKFARHLAIKGWDKKTQDRLSSAHIFVAGAGGLGSPLLLNLAASGVGEITICDYDTVSISNLNRQILYNENDIDKSKVFTAAERLNSLNSSIKINSINETLSEKMEEQISSADLMIDCLDNFKARFILNKISLKTGIPFIHAGVSEYYGQITFIKPDETPCLGCFVQSDAENKNPGIIGATAGIVGSMQALEAIKYITGIGDNLKNRIIFIDGKTFDFTTINISKNPSCLYCGKKEIKQ
jgi:adenylyltransferase/sulfurtransferase